MIIKKRLKTCIVQQAIPTTGLDEAELLGPLREHMLPHLGVKDFAALRATCSLLCHLVDVDTASLWQERVKPLLPPCLLPCIDGGSFIVSLWKLPLCPLQNIRADLLEEGSGPL